MGHIAAGDAYTQCFDDIIKDVLVQVSEAMEGENKLEEKLQISEVECLTKPREDGRRIWSRTWRVQVPNRFRDYICKPEALPVGWTSRKYFPPRDPRTPRPPVPGLHPTGMPPEKKANLEVPSQF